MSTVADASRVYKFDKKLREAIKRTRAEKGLSQLDFFEKSVSEHLPPLVAALGQLKFEPTKNAGPIKMPVRESVLRALRRATAQTGIPATALVQVIMLQSTQEEEPKRRPRKARKPRAKAR